MIDTEIPFLLENNVVFCPVLLIEHSLWWTNKNPISGHKFDTPPPALEAMNEKKS